VPSDSDDLTARLKRIADLTDRLAETTADSKSAQQADKLAKQKLSDAGTPSAGALRSPRKRR